MNKKMNFGFVTRSVMGAVFVVVIAGTLLLIERFYENKNSEEIIRRTGLYLNNALKKIVTSYYENKSLKNFNYEINSLNELESADSTFRKITEKELIYFNGVEGGFYLTDSKKFVGFAFPTSPPPKPAYGPPPREYKILLDQIVETADKKKLINKVYQFEPTVFILATEHLSVNNKVIGVAYAMIRVEQLLPFSFYKKFFPIVLFLSFSGIGLAIYISWLLRKRVEEIKIGLEKIKSNQTLRLQEQKGILGIISKSINNLLDAREEEQRQRQRLEKELQMKERMASLGNLIAAVTHQIKTPLAIMKSKIQLWQRKIENSNPQNFNNVITKDSMTEVVTEIDRLAGLVNKLLLFLKNPVNNFEDYDINVLVEKVLHLLADELKKKNIKVDFIKDEIQKVRINVSSLEQVLINIIVNAIQAVDVNGHIEVITYQITDNQIAIEIKDNGPGISPEIMDKIFEPFFSTKDEGYGLGLSIAYEIIKLHKGSINVFQNEPKGTIFRIILPIR